MMGLQVAGIIRYLPYYLLLTVIRLSMFLGVFGPDKVRKGAAIVGSH